MVTFGASLYVLAGLDTWVLGESGVGTIVVYGLKSFGSPGQVDSFRGHSQWIMLRRIGSARILLGVHCGHATQEVSFLDFWIELLVAVCGVGAVYGSVSRVRAVFDGRRSFCIKPGRAQTWFVRWKWLT